MPFSPEGRTRRKVSGTRCKPCDRTTPGCVGGEGGIRTLGVCRCFNDLQGYSVQIVSNPNDFLYPFHRALTPAVSRDGHPCHIPIAPAHANTLAAPGRRHGFSDVRRLGRMAGTLVAERRVIRESLAYRSNRRTSSTSNNYPNALLAPSDRSFPASCSIGLGRSATIRDLRLHSPRPAEITVNSTNPPTSATRERRSSS